jgi:hypothetical protein
MSGDMLQLISLVVSPMLPRFFAIVILFLMAAAAKAELMKD